MAEVLNFSGESDGLLFRADDGTAYKDRVLIQFNHNAQGSTTISLGTLENGIQITANADTLFSFLVRAL